MAGSSFSPSIAIVGAGAVGGYYGGRLAQHGHRVHFLTRSDYAAIKANGLVVRSCDGDFTIPPDQVHVHIRPGTMPKVDLVIVTLKATANDQFEPLIRPLLHESTAILTLQNGLGNEEQLAELFGAERILGGLAFTCINRIGPGQIHHLDHGLIRLGDFTSPDGRSDTDRAQKIVDLFQASQVHCQILTDLKYGRWEKLVWNIPFNGFGAAMDLTTDQLLANEEGRQLVRETMQEVLHAAQSAGISLPISLIDKMIEQTRSMGAYKTSMQIDRQQGRAMEAEAIVGRPLAVARSFGVATPLLSMIYRMLRSVPL